MVKEWWNGRLWVDVEGREGQDSGTESGVVVPLAKRRAGMANWGKDWSCKGSDADFPT